jgi:hypothetical protein
MTITSFMDIGLSEGSVYGGFINRISSNGNAIVEVNGGHINLGKLYKTQAGAYAVFEYKGGHYGEVIDTTYVDRDEVDDVQSIIPEEIDDVTQDDVTQDDVTPDISVPGDTPNPFGEDPHDNKNNLINGPL